MFKSFESIYKFVLKIVFAIFTGVFALIGYGVSYFFLDNELIWIPLVLTGIIIGSIISSYLYVILLIPYMISKEFDEIQNKVALSHYKSTPQFQDEIAEFIFNFFKFPGAYIESGVFEFKDCPVLVKGIDENMLSKLKIKEYRERKENRQFKINKHSLFFLPINFGGHDLGYMVLFTKGFQLPFLKSILVDLINYYVDDQLMLVLKQKL